MKFVNYENKPPHPTLIKHFFWCVFPHDFFLYNSGGEPGRCYLKKTDSGKVWQGGAKYASGEKTCSK